MLPWYRALIAVALVVVFVNTTNAANLCLTLDAGGPFSTCATPSNADITAKFLPAYKPLCDASKGSSCSNSETWDYFATNALRGVRAYIEETLTDSVKQAVVLVTVPGFP